MAQAADSERAFNARFISSKPRRVSPSSIFESNGKSKPPNRSRWMNRTRPSPSGSIENECSPSNSPGNPEMTEPAKFPVGIGHQDGGAE